MAVENKDKNKDESIERAVVGIDLGTTNTVVAHIVEGKPEVIRLSSDSMLLPSVVLMDLLGQIVVGDDARASLVSMPDRTVSAIKRQMGDPVTVSLAGKAFSPTEISAMILREIKRQVDALYSGQEVEAVITVPAYFNEAQRRATKEAGELAGFLVERIINEPTAAALAFGFYHSAGQKSLLVYDLGGGTFDVSVVVITDGVLEVKSSTGNRRLGGEDFDWKLVDWMAEKVIKRHKVDPRQNLRARAMLKETAERLKIDLSDKGQAEATIPVLLVHEGEPISLAVRIDRKQFQELIRPWVEETMRSVDDVLQQADVRAQDVHEVILVGGSTRIPWIRDLVQEKFGRAPRTDVDPDLAVALGAAVQAGLKSGTLLGSGMVVTDVAPFSMGIAVAEVDWLGQFVPGHFLPIIPKNTTIPVVRTNRVATVYDNQTAVRVEVYQGESDRVRRNQLLGQFLVEGLPPAPAGKQAIAVTFRYNLNGMLEVTARSEATGREMAMVVQDALDRQSQEALEASKQRLESLLHAPQTDQFSDEAGDDEDDEMEYIEVLEDLDVESQLDDFDEGENTVDEPGRVVDLVKQAQAVHQQLSTVAVTGPRQKSVQAMSERLSHAQQQNDPDELLKVVNEALDLLIDLEF